MTALAGLVRLFAALLSPHPRNARRLQKWITTVAPRPARIHAFTRGLACLPHHNGRAEGASTKTRMIKRQMYGRAGFTLLPHRILFG